MAVGSKFLFRVNGKHLFNPANFGIVALLLLVPDMVWITPGQWGQEAWLTALLIALAALVLGRAGRIDTAVFFLASFCGRDFLHALALGDPMAIPLHHVQSGALLIFAFFMITDPRSTPNHWFGRLCFAFAVAMLGYWLQTVWQLRPGLLFALAAVSLTTPLIDRLLAGRRFVWLPEMFSPPKGVLS